MQVLITGVGGFVGHHLARQFLDSDPATVIHGTVLHPSHGDSLPAGVTAHALNLCDTDATQALVHRLQPAHIFHFAAQTSVGRSFTAAWDTLENNIRAQLNILQACLDLPTPPRILVVSSGEIYGTNDESTLPTDENAPFRPTSPYSVSKIAQDMLALQYFLSYHLPVVRVRPFNHFGPGQSDGFVAPAFALQIARIEAGLQPPKLLVGDLSPRRDFTDVRDMVRAYRLVIERGVPGEVYNVASGVTRPIQTLLDVMLQATDAEIEICPDPERMRPSSSGILWGDASRLRAATGWTTTIPFEQSALDVLNDCRERVRRSMQGA